MDLPNNLLPTRTKRMDYAIATHYVSVPSGVTSEMMFDPNFWQHVAARLRVGHQVCVDAEDGSFCLLARVMAIDPLNHWAVLRRLPFDDQQAGTAGAPDNHGYVVHHDPVQQYRILRGPDLVEHGFPTKDAADARLAELKLNGEKPAKK